MWTMDNVIDLSTSLMEFKSDMSHCVTLLLPPNADLNKVYKKLVRDRDYLSNEKDDIRDENFFRKKALDWVIKKFHRKITLPSTGIAIFAGVDTDLDADDQQFHTRIWVPIQPDFTIQSFSYVVDNQFHPEFLQANINIPLNFGIIILSTDLVTMAKYESGPRTLEFFTYKQRGLEHKEMERLSCVSDKYFVSEGKATVIGIVFGVPEKFNRPGVIDVTSVLSETLSSIPGIVVSVEKCGLQGARKAFDSTSDFRDKAIFTAQKEFIDENCVIQTKENEVPIESLMKKWGIGSMELLTCAKGQIIKKIEVHYANFKKKQMPPSLNSGISS